MHLNTISIALLLSFTILGVNSECIRFVKGYYECFYGKYIIIIKFKQSIII